MFLLDTNVVSCPTPYFDPNPNNRQNGWVNLTVDFLGEQGTGSKVNGWLTYNDDGADDTGVGGYQAVLRYAEGDDIEDATGAEPLSLTNLPSESEMNAYCAVVSAVDALGNESDLPDDEGTCVIAGVPAVLADDGTETTPATEDSYEALLRALVVAEAADPVVDTDVATAKKNLANAGLLAGVDITPPGIEIEEDDRINAVADLSFAFDIYDDENDEANSQLHSVAPLLVRVQRRTTDDTECLDIIDDSGDGTVGQVENDDEVSCTRTADALPNNTAITFADPSPNAYYTLSGAALDQAGNVSMIETHTFVFDATPSTATAPAAPGALEAGEAFQIASFLNDDLSIRDYYVTANFAGDIKLGVVHPTVMDAFDADPLTHRNYAVTVNVETYAGITTDPATAASGVTGVTVAVRGQAQAGTPAYTEQATTGFPTNAPGANDNFTDNFAAALSAIDAVCVAEDEDDCADDNQESETELEVVATADATGAFSDPFERVDFWMQDVNGASWLIGSDTSGESGRVGGATDDRRRTWTYSLDVSAADLYMLTREEAFRGAGADDAHTVRAFGVNDDGVAYALSGSVTIDDGES